MKKLIPLMMALLGAVWASAQSCPAVLNCPQGTQVFCDFSGNDSLLWNAAPLTHSIDHQTNDLYEGAANLSLNILGCKGGGALYVSFKLFLDLNQDNLEETVICSELLPQTGYVLANNAFNPDYTGGDLYLFDKRDVSDSLRYTFDLQLLNQGDTTVVSIYWHNLKYPNSIVTPRLPEGKHRIVWTVTQDSISTSCEYLLRIRDCGEPLVFCKDALSVDIDESLGYAIVPVSSLINYVEDNVTPNGLLQSGIRRSNTGLGFPADTLGQAVPVLNLGCEFAASTQTVEVWIKDKAGNTTMCESVIEILPSPIACALSVPTICSVPYNNVNLTLDGVHYELLWTLKDSQECKYNMPNISTACTELDSFPGASYFSIQPVKNTNPLNGVSTYDLLLMSKHILNVEPLDAAWKMIAGDVNRSGSITNFDIVELRKLLLGLHDKLPNSTSWRFYAAYCQFPPNPFDGWCPWVLTLENLPLENYDATYYFYGLKVGDVNGNAQLVDSLIGTETEPRSVQQLVTIDPLMESGTMLDIPVYVKDGGNWSGCQLELNYPAEMFQIEGIIPGNVGNMSTDHFAQPGEGRLTMSWFEVQPVVIAPGNPLFTLRVRAKSPLLLSDVLKIQTARIAAEAYPVAAEPNNLSLFFDPAAAKIQPQAIWAPQPNPTQNGAEITLELQSAENVLLTLMDMAGREVYQSQTSLAAGTHLLDLPAEALSKSGVYSWRVVAGTTTASGKLVRL
jgi:hypothetical protein